MAASTSSEESMSMCIPCEFTAAASRCGTAGGRLLAAAVLSLCMAPVQAQDPRERAVDAALADGVTTVVGVAASGGAIHPAGAVLATALKAVTFRRARELPEAEQPAAYAAASAMWMGGAASNICLTAVLLTGGGFAPACLAVGAAWGLKTWQDSEHERRYWERCTILRQFAVRQKIRCVYVPPGLQAAATKAPARAGARQQPTPPRAAAPHGVARRAAAQRTAAATTPPFASPFASPYEVQAP
jgi:hypothetical protein